LALSRETVKFKDTRLPEAKRRDADCGSPFLCLLSFGEAKESELPPGNPGQQASEELTCRRATPGQPPSAKAQRQFESTIPSSFTNQIDL
jgi:hypothetical protein